MVRFFLFLLLFLGGCTSYAGLNLANYPDPEASPKKFIHCHGYGCYQKTVVGFNSNDWQKIKDIFKNKAQDAQEERVLIAQAVADIEKYVGKISGTENDLPKAPIIRKSNKELDCIDETINTTKYLGFLEKENLFYFHKLFKPVHKGIFIDGVYPHNSATIKEIETGQIYVVDSYIFENGGTPVIRTFEDWKSYATFESKEY